MAELDPRLAFFPHHPGDPGPEVYRYLATLSAERQKQVMDIITSAHTEIGQIYAGAEAKAAQIKLAAYTKLNQLAAQTASRGT